MMKDQITKRESFLDKVFGILPPDILALIGQRVVTVDPNSLKSIEQASTAGILALLAWVYQRNIGAKRFERFRQEIEEGFQAVKAQIDEEYVKSEEYQVLFFKCLQSYSRADHEEKVRFYRNLLLNAAKVKFTGNQYKERVLRCLDTLTHDEVESFFWLCAHHTFTSQARFMAKSRDFIPGYEQQKAPQQRIANFLNSEPDIIRFNVEDILKSSPKEEESNALSEDSLLYLFNTLNAVGLTRNRSELVVGKNFQNYETTGFSRDFLKFIQEVDII